MRIILASKSPRRKRLLQQLGLNFKVVPSNADESQILEENPIELVRKLAMLKAATVANSMKREHAIIIGADSVISIDSEIIGKPGTKKRAAEILQKLSGREHRCYTGLCIINTKTQNVFTDVQKTRIRMRELTQKDIDFCLGFSETLNGAGAYIPETWHRLFASIDGSYTNVIGLPIEKLIPLLRENGVDI